MVLGPRPRYHLCWQQCPRSCVMWLNKTYISKAICFTDEISARWIWHKYFHEGNSTKEKLIASWYHTSKRRLKVDILRGYTSCNILLSFSWLRIDSTTTATSFPSSQTRIFATVFTAPKSHFYRRSVLDYTSQKHEQPLV